MSSITFSSASQPKPRWLLLGSLALNLFFIGIAGSMALRSLAPPAQPSANRDAIRIERIAETLPPADAEKLRSQFALQRAAVETARANIGGKQDAIRATLRAEPFSVEDMRKAMADSRAARETFYQTLGGVVSSAAAQMSPAGRNKLADWRPSPQN
jgi:uncharacterized membrane protein